MRFTFLGTGTSTGVPQIGCSCEVCTSANVKDKRSRCSALVEEGNTRILIDCGPDFRTQILGQKYAPISGVLLTHEHYDHVGGLDDLRPFCANGPIDVYGSERCLQHIMERMPYCFDTNIKTAVPHMNLIPVTPNEKIEIGGIEIVPIQVMHGQLPILGYKIKDLAYITDMLSMEERYVSSLMDIKILIENSLRYEPHRTHQTVADAVSFARRIAAKETYLIHMSHQIGLHDVVEKKLPAHFHLAYDGLVLNV